MKLWCKIDGHKWETLEATFAWTVRCNRCGEDRDDVEGARYDQEMALWVIASDWSMDYAQSVAYVVQKMAVYDRDHCPIQA